MAQPIFGIAEFPNDDRFWRVVLFGGVAKSPKVRSEPIIEVLLASLPSPDIDPLGKDAMQSFDTRVVKIGVGQLPYISTGSVWHRQRPAAAQAPDLHHIKLIIDTSNVRFISLGDLIRTHRVIPESRYAFGKLWPIAATTQMAAIEIGGDPWAVIIPVSEIIRFYYAPSTRLTQALFWGVYANSINVEKCGQLEGGPYRVHLRKWISDSDAWTLARFHASAQMRRETRRLYHGFQKYCVDSPSSYPDPFREFQCGFPFVGPTCIEAIHVALPGRKFGADRVLILRLLRCSGPFPFDQLLVDRDNRNLKGPNSGEEDLPPAWRQKNEEEDKCLDEWGNPIDHTLHSDSEPFRGTTPLVSTIREDRFAYLDGKQLLKEEPERQKYRSAPMVDGTTRRLRGFGTGGGIWGNAERKRAEINTSRPGNLDKPSLPVSLKTFFAAMRALSIDTSFSVRFVAAAATTLELTKDDASIGFPTYDPEKAKGITWATVSVDGRSRARQVVVAEVSSSAGVCYVFEAERLHDKETMSILVLTKLSNVRLSAAELHSLLLGAACKGRWKSESEMPEFRRKPTTHKPISSTAMLTNRIKNRICEILGIENQKKKAKSPNLREKLNTNTSRLTEPIQESG